MKKLKYIFMCILKMDYKSLFATTKKVHKITKKPSLLIFVDIIKCGFKYGAGYKDYLICEFYNLSPSQRATFVTRGINNTIVSLLNNSEYYHIFDNKTEFNATFKEYMHRKWLNFNTATLAEFETFMSDLDEVICKPDDLCCGEGVEKIKKADFKNLKEMYDTLKSKSINIVEEVIIQHPEMSKLNTSSVNTIRIYSILANDKVNTIYACVRMGNSDRPVDNINAGGMYSPVDLESGKISLPACDKENIVYETHPITGCKIQGHQIPYWQESLEMCREAGMKIPEIGYVGWDVAITEDGPLLIEANSIPGYDAYPQMPLQAPDKIGFLPTIKKYVKGL